MEKERVVLRDIIENQFEPYDRQYMLGIVARHCQVFPFLRNAGLTSRRGRGFRDGNWESHEKIVTYICFEVDGLTDDIWNILHQEGGIGSFAVRLSVETIDDEDVTILFPGN